MGLLVFSFLAGVLTVLAPCTLPLLPVIIGGSLGKKADFRRPLIITLSLALSITFFTLLLRATTAFIDIPPSFWKIFSASVLFLLGLAYLFPSLWQKVMHLTKIEQKTQKNLQESAQKKGLLGLIATGASLGPVFASCSPTYAFLLVTVLPQKFAFGVLNILFYALGLAFVLFLVAFLGQKATKNLKWAANPGGIFRKGLGILFIIIGIAIWTGLDKQFEAWVIDQGYFGALSLENRISDAACAASGLCEE